MCLGPIWTEKHETAKRLAQRIKTVPDVAKSKVMRSGENPLTAIKDAQALPKVKAKVKAPQSDALAGRARFLCGFVGPRRYVGTSAAVHLPYGG